MWLFSTDSAKIAPGCRSLPHTLRTNMNRCAVRQHSGVSRNVCAQTAMRSTLMVQKSYNGRMNMTSNRMNGDVKVQAVAGHGVSSSSPSVLAAAPVNPSIRIKLKSYWVDLLQDTVDKITDVAVNTGATIAGPVPLPTRCGDNWWSVVGCVCVWVASLNFLLKSGGLRGRISDPSYDIVYTYVGAIFPRRRFDVAWVGKNQRCCLTECVYV